MGGWVCWVHAESQYHISTFYMQTDGGGLGLGENEISP